MDREHAVSRTVYNSYILDDGWNAPEEITEAIDLKIEEEWLAKYRRVVRQNRRHIGSWLTKKEANRYYQLARPFLAFYDGQYIGFVRELGKELQTDYGITEIEAINILRGYHINDYVDKYYRIKNLIPDMVDQQRICEDTVLECGFGT